MRTTWSNRNLALPDIDPSIALVQAMRTEEKHRAIFWQKREIDTSSIGICSIRAGSAMAGIQNRTCMFLLILLVLVLVERI